MPARRVQAELRNLARKPTPGDSISLLRASNGFLQPGVIVPRLLATDEVDWFRVAHQATIGRAQDAVEVDPRGGRSHATLGWAYFFTGTQQEGIAELERAVALSPGNSLWLGQLGQAYAMTGETPKAREILRELEERAEASFVSPYHLAYVYTGLGDADRAMDLLERAVADRTGATYSIKGSFLFAPLRGHPRFRGCGPREMPQLAPQHCGGEPAIIR